MKDELNKMSIYQLKQLCSQILLTELKNCRFNIFVGFEINISSKICSIKTLKSKKIKIDINLNYIKKSLPIKNYSLIFKVYYCCFFIVQYMKQFDIVKQNLPVSYFEGLVYLDAIEKYIQKGRINIYSPIFHLYTKNKRPYCINPIEIYCAIKAIERTVMTEQLELNDNDKKILIAYKESLLQYSCLPEIYYKKKRIPVYAVINLLNDIAKVIKKSPDVINEFPILTLISVNKIKEISLKDFFLVCAESNSEFLMGVAIRLVAFLNLTYRLEYKNRKYERFIEEMKKYISTYVEIHGKIFMQESYFHQDNFLAAKKVVKKINRFLSMNNITVLSNNVHFIL